MLSAILYQYNANIVYMSEASHRSFCIMALRYMYEINCWDCPFHEFSLQHSLIPNDIPHVTSWTMSLALIRLGHYLVSQGTLFSLFIQCICTWIAK